MNIVEKLQKAIETNNWALVHEAFQLLGGNPTTIKKSELTEEQIEKQSVFEFSDQNKRFFTISDKKPTFTPTKKTKTKTQSTSIIPVTCVKCQKKLTISKKLVTDPYICNDCILRR